MPDTTQTRSISGSTTYVSSFSPVLGGDYNNGSLYTDITHGYWWGSEASNGAMRYFLDCNGSGLSTNSGGRRYTGIYIRCVQAP